MRNSWKKAYKKGGSKIPDLDLVGNPGGAELVKLHESEIGARLKGKNEKMAPLPGQLQKKTILGLLRKLAENSDKMAEAILGYKRWTSSST